MRPFRPGTILLLASVAALIAASILVADAEEDPLTQAQRQYDNHNYKQSLILADQVLASTPSAERLRGAQRIKALSLCMLGDRDGYQFAEQIISQHKPFSIDAELFRAMGDDRFKRWDRKRAYKYYTKAGELFEQGEEDSPAADAWFKAAESLQSRNDVLPAQQRLTDWRQRRQVGLDEIIKIYDHIVELNIEDTRKARALLLAGRAARNEGTWAYAEKGLARLTRAVEEFSLTYSAVEAQYEKGETYRQFRRFVQAVEAYGEVISNFGHPRMAKKAKQRIDEIRAPKLAVMATKPYLPGQKARLYWQARNIKRINLKAYRINLVRALGNITSRDGKLPILQRLGRFKGEQVADWSFTTPDQGKHEYYARTPDSEAKQTTTPIAVPFAKAGAYLIEAVGVNRENQSATSQCLVIFSNISAVAKSDENRTLVFTARGVGGEPVGGAEATVLRYWSNVGVATATVTTDDAGLAEIKLSPRRGYKWLAAVKKGHDQAICSDSSYYWRWWGWPRDYKVYGFTERPVYRPGQTVNFKQIVRAHKEGTYSNLPDTKLRVEIRNPKGETIYAKDHITDRFGAVEGSLAIKPDAPLGLYQIQVKVKGHNIGYWQAGGNRFRVEEYKKPEFKVTVKPGQGDYRIGEEMKIKIAAVYYFGQPVTGAEVKFTIRKQSYTHHYDWPRRWQWYYDELYRGGRRWGWWRWPRFDELVTTGTIKTDANGEALITIKADPIKNHPELDLKFVVEASVTDASRRVIRGSGAVKVTRAPFFIYPKPAQAVYGPGDSVEINVKTEDPNGNPVAGAFQVEAWKIQRIAKTIQQNGKTRTVYEEKLLQKVFAGDLAIPQTGRASLRFIPDMTGRFKIIVKQAAAKDGQSPVEGSCELWIASKTGAEAHYAYSDLKLIPASDQYEIGDTMKLLINTNKTDSHVLLTGEAGGLLFWRIVHVPANSKLVEIPIDKPLTPNFTLTATMIADNKVYRDSKQIIVPPTHRFIKVEATTTPGSAGGGKDKGVKKYQPREKTTVRIKLTDVRTGKPIVGQAAVMMVDSSVYYIQPEFREAIEKAFYGQVRRVNVATADSFAGPGSLNPRLGYPARGRKGRPYTGAEIRLESALADSAAPMAAPALGRMAKGMAAEMKQQALVAPVVREHFRDTVLWAGSVVTDADGTAEIPVTLPDQLTTFALHVISFDTDTRVGQAKTEVITTKRIIVRLESGRFFTQGDHSYVTVIAHNYYDQPQGLKVDLTASENLQLRKVNLAGKWRDYSSGDPLAVTVPAGGEVRLDFLTTALRPGDVKLLARARGAVESDAIQLTKPIIEWGAAKLTGAGGTLRGDQPGSDKWTFTVPEQIKAGSQSLTVTLNPSIAAVALDALPFLARYPYGCVEQTMSRFLPTVIMRKTLGEAGISLDELREHIAQQAAAEPKLAAKYKFIRQRIGRNPVYSDTEVDRMIAKGLKRLADMQHGDGGWGWWKGGSSNPYMTAYVAYGLSVARDCDVKLPSRMLDRAAKYLIARAAEPKGEDQQNWWRRHRDNDNTRSYMLHVIGQLRPASLRMPKLKAQLKRIYAGRDELTDYGRAYLALALHAAGMAAQAQIVVENFDNTAVVDSKTNTAHWGRTAGWWYWYHGGTETTAWVAQAMMTVTPDSKYIPMAVNWLVRNRRELAWHNTKATATAVFALARYAKTTGELDCDQTFEVVIDDSIRRTVRVTKANLFTFDGRIVVPADQLAPGTHTVAIRRSGSGALYWGAYLRYFTTAERIKGGGHQLAIERKYFRLVPEKFTNTRRVWKDGEYVTEQFPDIRHNREPLAFGAEITTGELLEVQLEINADHNFEYMVFEDPKPAGCEPYRLTSGGSYGGGTYANIELRDTKVAFFATYLRKGVQTLTYRLVCEQPGTFGVLPSSGEAMYSPFVEAISDSGKIVVTVKAED